MNKLWDEYASHVIECDKCAKAAKLRPNTREFYTAMCGEGVVFYKTWRAVFHQ